MTENEPIRSPSSFRLPKETIGDLDAITAARVMAASSDIAMVIDREGIIRDLAISAVDMPMEGFADIVERRWIDTVTVESRRKVEEMLRDAAGNHQSRWREVNQKSPDGSIPFRYVALNGGSDGRVIALGRDLRGVAGLQQQIIQAQQEMERNYVRLRQAESRYRVLFQIASEAVLIVDPVTKKIVEANPAAGRLLGLDYTTLSGKLFTKLFHEDARDLAMSLLVDSSTKGQTESISLRMADGRTECNTAASLFRHDDSAHVLVSLSKVSSELPIMGDDSKLRLLRILNQIPDAFVITDEALKILEVNLAFLDLTQLPTAETAKGLSLGQFLGRPGVDLRVLVGNLREHRWVRNFGTVIRTTYGEQEEVELSAVSVSEGLEVCHGFIIRRARRVSPVNNSLPRGLPRTAEQLTQLVGRVSLREIVAETTDVIEHMCIEAALALTGNNRVYAAEVLGLSRQSLYSKLKRHGVGNPDSESDASLGH